MESRLPKPTSMLRKPTQRVPTDRLVNSNTSLTSTSKLGVHNRQPLVTNFENILHEFRAPGMARKRAASPEFRTHDKDMHRPKLRRSRSLSDFQNENGLRQKSAAPSLSTIYSRHQVAKPTNGKPSVAEPSRGLSKPRFGVSRPVGTAAASKPATGVTKPTVGLTKVATAANRGATTAARPATTAAKAATATSATNGPSGAVKKVAPKKIPPYDFKARFADLTERHKALRDKYQHLQDQMGELDSLPELYEQCQQELDQVKNELKNVRVELECMQRQNNANKAKADELTIKLETTTEDLTSKLTAKTEECRAKNEKCMQLEKQNTEMGSDLAEYKIKSDDLCSENKNLHSQVDNMKEMLFKYNIERKDLHNTIMDLRGNIRVFCRVRPPLPSESEIHRQLCSWQYYDETSLEISNCDAGKKPIKHDFSFDQVFPPNTRQSDIFELVSPLVQSAMDGYNICIFAYGQTGSGKTYTMDGLPCDNDLGIIPRTIDLLFDCFKHYRQLGWEYEIKASFLEIYNEVLFDLLSNETKDMDIKMANVKNPMEIYVSNLTEVPVSSGSELHELMRIAKSNRATAATAGNERSSRSHAVTRIQLIGRHAEKNELSVGAINLIDLAGSESPKTSVRMNETKNINKSLSELTNVIMALLQRNDHVPYRNSKLTHLLMPSLGGNSKTLMFINVSPFQDCFVESVKSLRFAASVNSCKIAKAKKNKFMAPQTTPPGSTNSSNTNLSSSISSN